MGFYVYCRQWKMKSVRSIRELFSWTHDRISDRAPLPTISNKDLAVWCVSSSVQSTIPRLEEDIVWGARDHEYHSPKELGQSALQYCIAKTLAAR